MQDWLTMGAACLGRAIADGRIDPVELTRTYLDAIADHPLRDRIYARITEGRAMEEATAARNRAATGRRLSALDGVPISWKDLFDTAGIATEAGSRLLKGRVPKHDARVLANTAAAGLVCLGKTHMSELAFSGLGYNPATATPPCVNNANAIPGGSSSGAAASVAFGLATAGIGSDTGGSVRCPAAWNDLVGLKTTSGRLSLDGVVPLCPSFDTVGPLSRTVEDAALLLAVLEGQHAPDLTGATLEGMRIARLRTVAEDGVHPEPATAYRTALDRIADGGAIVDDFEWPELARIMSFSGTLYTVEAYGQWRDVIEANPDLMYHNILERFRLGRNVPGADYVAARRELGEMRRKWNSATAGYDAVTTPTVPILPPELDRIARDSAHYAEANALALRNTRIGNLLGLSAVTLPTETPSCGLMLMGRPHAEASLLRLAVAIEARMAKAPH